MFSHRRAAANTRQVIDTGRAGWFYK